jgi:tripartite-type tricarboxylate transporter receptor subunit TctC
MNIACSILEIIKMFNPSSSEKKTSQTRRRTIQLMGAAIAAVTCFGTPALASGDYPNRAIRMVIPFPAGGPADFVGRLYAQHLTKLAGQPVVIENIAGAAGSIGTNNVARAEPNGYSILFGTTSTMAINQVLMPNLPYEFQKDFAQIGLIANAPHVMVVSASVPANNLAEFIALAKAKPGALTFGSAGVGSIVQMGSELVKVGTGIDVLHVPYKGGAPATMALLKGEVDMTVNDLTTLKANIDAGKVRALAVANGTRLKPLPNVPTFAELGFPQVMSSTWWGISVPVKTPVDIQKKLQSWNDQIIRDPAYVAKLAEVAIDPILMTPAEATAFINAETAKWRDVATKANIQLNQ